MMMIGPFAATLAHVAVGRDDIALWRVAELERHVDRRALLAGDDAPEPPYWAHLWSGAVALAEAIPSAAGTAIELGCGLGLPGLVAARRGATVTFVDRVPAALAFVRASARANGIAGVRLLAADLTTPALRARFDLVLAAEILYDRSAFGAVAGAIAARLAPAGRALLADAGRIDTRAFYDHLEPAGLRWRSEEREMREEGLPIRVRVVELRHRIPRGAALPGRGRPG
jgi:predicted nicotinamide N-methyase